MTTKPPQAQALLTTDYTHNYDNDLHTAYISLLTLHVHMYIRFGLTRAAAKENPTSRGGLSSLDNQSAPLPDAMTMEPRGQLSNQTHKDPVWGRTGPVRLPAGWTLENKGNEFRFL